MVSSGHNNHCNNSNISHLICTNRLILAKRRAFHIPVFKDLKLRAVYFAGKSVRTRAIARSHRFFSKRVPACSLERSKRIPYFTNSETYEVMLLTFVNIRYYSQSKSHQRSSTSASDLILIGATNRSLFIIKNP